MHPTASASPARSIPNGTHDSEAQLFRRDRTGYQRSARARHKPLEPRISRRPSVVGAEPVQALRGLAAPRPTGRDRIIRKTITGANSASNIKVVITTSGPPKAPLRATISASRAASGFPTRGNWQPGNRAGRAWSSCYAAQTPKRWVDRM